RAAEPACASDPHALGPEAHRTLHRLLHGAPECDPLLQLEGNVLSDELRVELRVHHLLDVEVDLLPGPRLQLVLELLDLGTLPADDDPRPGGVHRDARPVRRALEVDSRDARMVQGVLDVAPDLDVLVGQIRVLLPGEPPRAPRPRRAQPEADRVDLLSHYALLVVLAGRRPAAARAREAAAGRRGAAPALAPVSARDTVMCASRCRIQNARPIARGWIRLSEGPPSITGFTRRSSRLRTWWLCSALATADRSTFSICRAATCGEYCRIASASATDLPRTRSATSRALRGDTRM